jgi:hypothetical protein
MEGNKLQIPENGVLWKIFGRNTMTWMGNLEYYIMKNFMVFFGSYTYMSDKGNHKFVQNADRETTWKAIACNTEEMVGQHWDLLYR